MERRIGPYRLTREIGRGGMGAVYRALRDDDAYRTEVAIKLLARELATADDVARFRDERQILATLEHPGIVRLLDGGNTDEGLPYLVMEYVEGPPITRFADERGLGVRARVALLRRVCDAVGYAHQRLVVHRDLKPSNILVAADGAPKLLDFGIAKLVVPAADRAAHTATGASLWTPEYASPEQLRGRPVTLTTDIYSLGVVLHELLTGAPVHRFAPGSELALLRATESDPPRPSSVAPPARRRAIAGDLDNILAKALHRDPERRYASVEQLADDLDRHLGGLPVLARAPTLAYRAGKFVRRNRVAVAAVTVVLAALVAATVVSVGQARRADLQARRAQQRFDEARRMVNAMLFDVNSELFAVNGTTAARQVLVSRALEYIDGLAGGAEDDSLLRRDLAHGYVQIADIQGSWTTPNVGRSPEVLASLDKALRLYEQLAAEPQSDPQVAWEHAWVHAKLMFHHNFNARSEDALNHAREALAIAQRQPRDAGYNYRLPMAVHVNLVRSAGNRGDLAAMERHAAAAAAFAEQWRPTEDSSPQEHFVPSTGDIAAVAFRSSAGDVEAAIRASDRMVAVHAEVARRFPKLFYVGQEYASALSANAAAHGAASPIWPLIPADEAAEARLRELVAREEAALAQDPDDADTPLLLWKALGTLAATLAPRDPAAALQLFERADAVVDPGKIDPFMACARAVPLARLGRREQAIAALTAGLAGSEQPDSRREIRGWLQLAQCRHLATQAHQALGDREIAARMAADSVAEARAMLARFPDVIYPYVAVVEALALQASLEPTRGCALLGEAVAVWRSWPHAPTAYTERRLAELVDAHARCPGPLRMITGGR